MIVNRRSVAPPWLIINFIGQWLCSRGQLTETPVSTTDRVGECPSQSSAFDLAQMSCTTDSNCVNQLCCMVPNMQELRCVDGINTDPTGSSMCTYDGIPRSHQATWRSSSESGNADCSCDNGVVLCTKPGDCSVGFQEPGSGQCQSCSVGRDDQCNSTSKCCPSQNSCTGSPACFQSTATLLQCATNDNQQRLVDANTVGRSFYQGLPSSCQDCFCNGSSGSFSRRGGCVEECVPGVCYFVVSGGSAETVRTTLPRTFCTSTGQYQCACTTERLVCKQTAGPECSSGISKRPISLFVHSLLLLVLLLTVVPS